jgi:hypothetical protein
VAGVGANVSLLVCGKAIELVNAVTAAITGQGVDGQTATTAIEQIVDQQLTNAAPPLVFTLLELAVEVMAIVVVMTFILRVALLVILLGIAPLALMCHATPQTEGLAYAWWRAFGACLGMQVGQAVIILATVRVFLTPVGSQIFGVPTSRNRVAGDPGVPVHAVVADQAARVDEERCPRPARPGTRTGRADHPRRPHD